MGEVDSAFVQALEHRPKTALIEAEGIPLIDISAIIDGDSANIPALIAEIRRACEDWGFFQVVNHGVSSEFRARIEAAAMDFFKQGKEEKRKLRRDEVNPMGYYDGEHTKNVRDWKEVLDLLAEVPTAIPASHEEDDHGELRLLYNQWPQWPLNFREACEEYVREMEKLSHKLLELISLSLDLPANTFSSHFKDQTSFVRFNYYPVCPIPHLALGVGRHKDAGALTVLAQDAVEGLEVKRKTDGEWVRVKAVPDAYIVNVGDVIQVWSNDKYESVEHRVMVNSERERFSIPFFFNPAHYTVVEPIPELLSDQNPRKYRPFNWGKMVSARALSNFKKQDVENLEIHHFKISG